MEWNHPPPAPVQFAGPASTIIVEFDPQTLKLVFEYAAALVLLYKSTNYVGEFFNSCIKKLGELAGAKIAEALSKLWNKVYKRVHDVNRAGDHTRVYFACHVVLEGTSAEIDNAIFYSHFEDWTNEDVEKAYWLMVLRVIPVLDRFASAFGESGVRETSLHAMLYYPTERLGHWVWEITANPIGRFFIGPDGRLQIRYGLLFANKEPLDAVAIEDIKSIVRAYVESETEI